MSMIPIKIKRREPIMRWIPCSERLPETEDKVLCCTATKKGGKNIVIGYYMATMKYWVCGMNSNVIAWMPLPEPYKGETAEESAEMEETE